MKLRSSFVSNSSSASFIIPLQVITLDQADKIFKHRQLKEEVLNIKIDEDDFEWIMEIIGTTFRGYTSMDNFDMYRFMQNIGVPMKDITFIPEIHSWEKWTEKITDKRELLRDHIGEYVEFIVDELDNANKSLEKVLEKRKENYKDMKPTHIIWVDPDFYSKKENNY